MKVHIVGAGPTGMSLAWELLRSGDHEVTIYDRKMSAGGSWWEPDEEVRDLHAHRIVFDRAFVNTRSLSMRWVYRGIPCSNPQKMEVMSCLH
jgi:cation diffusion facilitator CzcD-associated flavoprotein CzcO